MRLIDPAQPRVEIDNESIDMGSKSKLIKTFNISLMPHWAYHPYTKAGIPFTLVFEGIDKDCSFFWLQEVITKPCGFYINTVRRSSSDMYEVKLLT